MSTFTILSEVDDEREYQKRTWGEQNFQFKQGTFAEREVLEDGLQYYRDNQTKVEGPVWRDILMEEVCEAFLENDPDRQREEMIQVAAVAVQIIEYLDRRKANGSM